VVALGVAEALEDRHLDAILRDVVVGPVPAMADRGAGGGEEPLGALDPLDGIDDWLGEPVVVRRQAVDLLDVEDRVAFYEGDGLLQLFAGVFIVFGAG